MPAKRALQLTHLRAQPSALLAGLGSRIGQARRPRAQSALAAGGYSRDFTYDDLNRLVTANSGTSLWGAGSYAYDAMGNITSRSLGTAPVDDGTILSVPGRHFRASASVTGVVDKLAFAYHSTTPQIDVATWNGIDHTVTYDPAGNELSYFATRTWSPRNLPATVTDNSGEGTPHTISYGYDARGVRVVRSESPTASGTSNRYFTYPPELQLLNVTDDDTSNLWASGHASIESAPIPVSHEYAYFNGIPVGELGPPRTPDSTVALTQPRHRTSAVATTLYYTFTDHLGTPILQTDSTGAVVWRAEYEPYGNVWKMRTGARTDQPLRLPGQDLAMTWEGAEESYNVFRWYRAGWGRYSQSDPIGLRAGTNLFAYVSGNPIKHFDPRGEDIEIRKGTQDPNDPAWMNYHEAICVDTWAGCKNGCPGRSLGKLCFTFGWNNKWKVAPPSFKWMGKFTPWINPGTGMVGEVYITDLPPTVVDHKSTDCKQDMDFVTKLLGMLGTQDTYTCGFYNCVNWVHSMYAQAP